jgi:hypothetical protein
MTVHADFTSQEYFRNLTAEIEKLKAAGPVVEVRFPLVGTVWTTTTQGLANQVLRDSGPPCKRTTATSSDSDGGSEDRARDCEQHAVGR